MRKLQSCGLQDSRAAAQSDPVSQGEQSCFSCLEAWEPNKAFVLEWLQSVVLNGLLTSAETS